jgi:branched-chain amino acid transport system substrate-binding protein
VALVDDTIKIGLSGAFTGSSSPRRVSMRDRVKLALSEVNKSGGVLGKQIELVERDDEANSELGVQIAQKLVKKKQVIATVGYVTRGWRSLRSVSIGEPRFP